VRLRKVRDAWKRWNKGWGQSEGGIVVKMGCAGRCAANKGNGNWV